MNLELREGRCRGWLCAAAALLLGIAASACAQRNAGYVSPVSLDVDAPVGGPVHAPEPAAASVLWPNSISGTVTDADGGAVAGARVQLLGTTAGAAGAPSAAPAASGPPSPAGVKPRETTTSSDGSFDFEGVVPGAFRLRVSAKSFAPVETRGLLQPGAILQLPPVVLGVAGVSFSVDAIMSPDQIAEQQVHAEEHQRLAGVLPNFFISYSPNPAPLSPRQKFSLAFHNAADPANLVLVGVFAGVQQAQGALSGYGPGAQGFGKRYGANLANLWIGSYVSGAVLPVLFRQDPRYFYKGTGSVPSRAFYAASRIFVARGDNGKWQPNYSEVLGDFSEGALSNLYYPASDREGAELTLENGALALVSDAVDNILQEFLFSRITTHPHKKKDTQPPED